jgi:hypothetical protein
MPQVVPQAPPVVVSPPPVVAPPPPSLDVGAMVRQAMATNMPGPMREAAERLEKAGYPNAARELRKAASMVEAANAPGSPTAERLKKLGVSSLDAGMSQDLADQVQGLLQRESDPKKLEGWAGVLEQQNYPNSARALRAKATAIRIKQGAGGAMREIEKVLDPEKAKEREAAVTSPGWQDPNTGQTKTNTETEAKADKVTEDATEAQGANPAVDRALGAAASAAAKAAEAAEKGDANKLAEAANEAAEAAAASLDETTRKKASDAVKATREAVETGDKSKANEAAAKIVDAAEAAVTDLSGSKPGPKSESERLAHEVAANLRATKPGQEDRGLVMRFQEAEGGTKTRRGRAGLADGFYGPKTAIALKAYMPKVPAPRYWPRAEPSRSRAKAQWRQMVDEGKVAVGHAA